MASDDIANSISTTLKQLEAPEQSNLLDQIDKLRESGVQDYVSLPQLVVCGDQSAGKSSVLEALTQIPFPRSEKLCTKFATEIILRRSSRTSVTVRIKPGGGNGFDRTSPSKNFKEDLKDIADLPILIEKASTFMGLDKKGRGQSKDVLTIEILGPDKPQLTVVDLPGYIHSANSQQSPADIEAVKELVRSFIQDKRTIILAIVSAQSDTALQAVFEQIRGIEGAARRTMGIITKPDKPTEGSDSQKTFIALARNEDAYNKFGLGWHVLRNRGFGSITVSNAKRDQIESTLFSSGAWSELDSSCLGIKALRLRLSKLLHAHICDELPELLNEIRNRLTQAKSELQKMGDARSDLNEQRRFLYNLSQEFGKLTSAGVDGTWEHPFFSRVSDDEGGFRRLRSAIQYQNEEFATNMVNYGHQFQVVKKPPTETLPRARRLPIYITEDQAVEKADQVRIQTRGRELPGNINAMSINPLFQDQSKYWNDEAEQHVSTSYNWCCEFVKRVIFAIADEPVAEKVYSQWLKHELSFKFEKAKEELKNLYKDNTGHAITYNQYYKNTVIAAKQNRQTDDSDFKLRRLFKLGDKEDIVLHKSYEVTGENMRNVLTHSLHAGVSQSDLLHLWDQMLAYYDVSADN
jgi:GTP-binding protein EngB required for normal cell division